MLRSTIIFHFQFSILCTLGQFNSRTCKTNFSNGERRFAVLSVFQINIFLVFGNAHICRTDNLTAVDKLLKSVCAPTRNTSCCKKRSIKLTRNIKKAVKKSAVEIDICGNALVDFTLSADNLRSQSFNSLIKIKFIIVTFGKRKLLTAP